MSRISDNQRGRFIHEKYVEKKYALNLKKPTPDMVSDGEDDDVVGLASVFGCTKTDSHLLASQCSTAKGQVTRCFGRKSATTSSTLHREA